MPKKLTLAITGHRDMIETRKLKKEVANYLETLLLQYKEIVLLSPLADGADRFVAELFLNKKEQYPKLRLKVPMPFSQERYMKDFDEVSKKEFLHFLNYADTPFTITQPDEKNNYQKLGYYIANNCDILLALWDKTFNGKSGGTSDVVAYAQSKSHQVKVFQVQRKANLKI